MTIDEALRDLQARVRGELYIKGVDNCEDIKLGIEALKAWKQFKEGRWMSGRYDLPGETEE